MKKKLLAIILALTMLLSCAMIPAQAIDIPEAAETAIPSVFQAVRNYIAEAVEDVTDVASLPPSTLFSARGFFIVLDKFVSQLVKGILTVVETLLPPAREREDLSDYTNDNFLEGNATFLNAAPADGKFKLGYDARSILPADFGEKSYRMGGYDFNKFSNKTYDDLKVRTIVLDDTTGRGAVAFAVLDVIGLANSDVRVIRSKLKDLTDSGALASVNVSVTHTHSAIDSQGLWGNDLIQLIPNNVVSAYLPSLVPPVQGIDQTFLNTIVNQTVDSVRTAYAARETGDLYFAQKNAKEYFSDKIDPYVFFEDVTRIRFQPDNADSKQTIIASFGAHPERVGMITDDNPGNVVSADFVPYIEEVVSDPAIGNANFIYLQGAIGTRIAASTGPSDDGLPLSRLEGTQRYGREMGYFILGMTETEEACELLYAAQMIKDEALIAERGIVEGRAYTAWYKNWKPVEETRIDPYFNIAHKEVLLEVKNPLLKAVGKLWLADNKMIVDHNNGKTYTLTEVGYFELGSDIKVLLQPGETSPELVLGGSNLTAEGSVTGLAFPYAPLNELVDEKLLVFDLMNDSIGYIIPDNDSTSLLLRYIDGEFTDTGSIGSNLNDSLLLTFSTKVASSLVQTFLDLVESKK
ncbi:MAG: hypothetical protein LBB67_01110 [Oscillospiraceae bacterium]|jgi:hypothetical protein|nr:hypothetical protein [Oscillospiraceae bacterium]